MSGEADAPTAAEAAEIERRLEDVGSGRVQAVDGDDAYAAVLQRLRDRNPPRSSALIDGERSCLLS